MKRFNNILVSVDTRLDKHPALAWATRLAEHDQAKLKMVDVVPEFSWLARLVMPDPERTHQVLVEEKTRNLQALAAPLRAKGIDVSIKVLLGKTSFEMMREVLHDRHDLVVRVTKGASSRRAGFLGTTSIRLLRKCPCPVWLVRTDQEPRFDRVLAAVAVQPTDETHEQLNKDIMELARSVAQYEGGQCHVVHAWELFGEAMMQIHWPEEYKDYRNMTEAQITSAFNTFLAPYGLNVEASEVHLLQGDPAQVIPELVKQANIDLIVMGTVGRTGIRGLIMGNTAERLLGQVECSVLALKPEGYISPVTLEERERA
jgi:universal stress protein E